MVVQPCGCGTNKYLRWRWADEVKEDPNRPGYVLGPDKQLEVIYNEKTDTDHVYTNGLRDLDPDIPHITFTPEAGYTYYFYFTGSVGPVLPAVLGIDGDTRFALAIGTNTFYFSHHEASNTQSPINTHEAYGEIFYLTAGTPVTIALKISIDDQPTSTVYAGTSLTIFRVKD